MTKPTIKNFPEVHLTTGKGVKDRIRSIEYDIETLEMGDITMALLDKVRGELASCRTYICREFKCNCGISFEQVAETLTYGSINSELLAAFKEVLNEFEQLMLLDARLKYICITCKIY